MQFFRYNYEINFTKKGKQMVTKGQAQETYAVLNSEGIRGGLTGKVKLLIHDELGNTVGAQELYEGVDVHDEMLNQSLDTAKVIFSRLAGGDMGYKIARIALGKAGRHFDYPKQAVDATQLDEELRAATLIKLSLNSASADDHFLYEHTNLDMSTTSYRMVYVEKEILAEHIGYGQDGNQFIVRVPISYAEFNGRIGDVETKTTMFKDETLTYSLISDVDGTIMEFGGVDSNGDTILAHTEGMKNAGGEYTFKNGLDGNGVINTTDGGDRPQEISEILLCADITGAGTPEDPSLKLATSRMTSGLLSFPEGFTFTYEWTLSWNFPAA